MSMISILFLFPNQIFFTNSKLVVTYRTWRGGDNGPKKILLHSNGRLNAIQRIKTLSVLIYTFSLFFPV